jgi:hypothetical protein
MKPVALLTLECVRMAGMAIDPTAEKPVRNLPASIHLHCHQGTHTAVSALRDVIGGCNLQDKRERAGGGHGRGRSTTATFVP